MEQSEISAIRAEVAAGIKDAVSDPDTWAIAFDAFNKYAQSQTGRIFLGGVWTVLRKLAFIGMIVVGVYAIGGIPAVVALFKASNT